MTFSIRQYSIHNSLPYVVLILITKKHNKNIKISKTITWDINWIAFDATDLAENNMSQFAAGLYNKYDSKLPYLRHTDWKSHSFITRNLFILVINSFMKYQYWYGQNNSGVCYRAIKFMSCKRIKNFTEMIRIRCHSNILNRKKKELFFSRKLFVLRYDNILAFRLCFHQSSFRFMKTDDLKLYSWRSWQRGIGIGCLFKKSSC